MEVRIRLQKSAKGANKKNNYRVVAVPKKKSRHARHLEAFGYYDPARSPAYFHVDKEKLEKWVKKGATVTDTVKFLLKQSEKKS